MRSHLPSHHPQAERGQEAEPELLLHKLKAHDITKTSPSPVSRTGFLFLQPELSGAEQATIHQYYTGLCIWSHPIPNAELCLFQPLNFNNFTKYRKNSSIYRTTFSKGLKILCLFLNRIKHKGSLLLLFLFVIKWETQDNNKYVNEPSFSVIVQKEDWPLSKIKDSFTWTTGSTWCSLNSTQKLALLGRPCCIMTQPLLS